MLKDSARIAAQKMPNQAKMTVQRVRAKTGWDEKVLHVPADIAVMVVSITSVSGLGVLAALTLVALILLAAVVFQ